MEDLIRKVTREVCEELMEALVPHLPVHERTGGCLEGWCGIGASMVAVRLRRLGVDARLVEGYAASEGHVWVQVGDLVADPTVGQYYYLGVEVAWWVGPPLPLVHAPENWTMLCDPDWEEWPRFQRPDGPRARAFLGPEDLELLKTP